MRTRNLIAAIFLLLLCAGYAYMTANLATRAIENTTQPSFFPWIITICLALLSLSLLVKGLFALGSDKTPKAINIPTRRLLLSLILFVAYLVALPLLGFAAANLPLFAGLMYFYGERRPLWIAGGSTLITVIIFYLFREAFQIRLPAGILEGLI